MRRAIRAASAGLVLAALLPAVCAAAGSGGGVTATQTIHSPLQGTGMWIWQLRRSTGGNLAAIVAKARRYGLRTVIIKSADGRQAWPQFSRQLIDALHAGGLNVCAYQYIYGRYPIGEAVVGTQVVSRGADCLVIDAEVQYERRYRSAAIYMRELRKRIGSSYPVALTSLPYVDYHQAFPYSVFLAPGAAQFSMPQMYWRAIGTSVDTVFSHTYKFNRVYQRPLYPVGQLWQHPSPKSIMRFRSLAAAYGAEGVSWWDWQEAAEAGWRALAVPAAAPADFVPSSDYPLLRRRPKGRTRGDLVVWAQQHLISAGQALAVNGIFGALMEREVSAFQLAKGILPSGQIDAPTWQALLAYPPAPVAWDKRRGPAFASAATARAARSEFVAARR